MLDDTFVLDDLFVLDDTFVLGGTFCRIDLLGIVRWVGGYEVNLVDIRTLLVWTQMVTPSRK